MIECNDIVPNLPFTATSGISGHLHDFKGQWLVIYFYPRDATPGCTTEGQDFRDNYAKFKALNTQVFGLSRDPLRSHENFKAKQQFPFELISDSDENWCLQFNVMRQKNMYGKKVRGIERSTFIINPDSKLVHEWRKVSIDNHVNDVLETLKTLQG